MKERNKVVNKEKFSILKSIDRCFEKKILHILDFLDEIRNNPKINKMTENRVINGILTISAAPPYLTSLIGIVHSLMDGVYTNKDTEALYVALKVVNTAILGFVTVFIILDTFYTLIKIVKYEVIKVNNPNICYELSS
ncbi:hypothetical protein MKS88_000580 [Plasmodium brasilianum]|uniref:MotA/TolQ/ExbB proton channel domain-containing protein n=2 Tax=Plasmodium (Plasmodium) TaxID=418103 RepID=A0A1A8WZ12_PLAMA|nr:hypothetical protein MKS88_000580 [Plasmodium brasilianum]SBS96649.1 Plasmodium exported protein (Pm-fam-a like), unknown function [Plasmodium malariae]